LDVDDSLDARLLAPQCSFAELFSDLLPLVLLLRGDDAARLLLIVASLFSSLDNSDAKIEYLCKNMDNIVYILDSVRLCNKELYNQIWYDFVDLLADEAVAVQLNSKWEYNISFVQLAFYPSAYVDESTILKVCKATIELLKRYYLPYKDEDTHHAEFSYLFYICSSLLYNYKTDNVESNLLYNFVEVLHSVLVLLHSYNKHRPVDQQTLTYITYLIIGVMRYVPDDRLEQVAEIFTEYYDYTCMREFIVSVGTRNTPKSHKVLEKYLNYIALHQSESDCLNILVYLLYHLFHLYPQNADSCFIGLEHLIYNYGVLYPDRTKEEFNYKIRDILKEIGSSDVIRDFVPRYIDLIRRADRLDNELFVDYFFGAIFKYNNEENVRWLVEWLLSQLPEDVNNAADQGLRLLWRHLLYYIMLRASNRDFLIWWLADVFNKLSPEQQHYLLDEFNLDKVENNPQNIIAGWQTVALLITFGEFNKAASIISKLPFTYFSQKNILDIKWLIRFQAESRNLNAAELIEKFHNVSCSKMIVKGY